MSKYEILVVSILILGILIVAALAYRPPHEKYKSVYDECIASEILTIEQCNDIALAAVEGR